LGKNKEQKMNLSPISSPPIATAATAQQLQTTIETQVSMLKELADQQALVARMLTESGLGTTIDVMA
jgi:hypothetical protein